MAQNQYSTTGVVGSTMQLGATTTAALTLGGGTSSTPLTTSTANKNFVGFWTSSTATSGDSRGVYNRHYLLGAGLSGEALRNFTTVGALAATAHGTHNSLSFAAGMNLSGQGVVDRNTLQIPNEAFGGGTYAAQQAEIWSDGASSDPATCTQLSFMRFVNGGNATGQAKVDDKAFLFTIEGGEINTGNMMAVKSSAAVSHVIRIKGPDGNSYYLMVSDAI